MLPMSECDNPPIHSCGTKMKRVFTPFNTWKIVTGREKVYKTLNKEDGYDFPGGNKHRKRYEQVLAKGLEQKG